MTIYTTQEWDGYGKNDGKYWNEYRLEGNEVQKVRCHSYKFFNNRENEKCYDEDIVESWSTDDPNMPEWLKQYI